MATSRRARPPSPSPVSMQGSGHGPEPGPGPSTRSAPGPRPRRAAPRPYHHGDLRRTLLDAALALVEEEGIGGLSMREVAKRAGVTHAAPYHHFADRGAVMAAIAVEGFSLLRDEMDAAAAAVGGATGSKKRPRADERLAACGRGYVRFALEHRAHFRVMFRPELCDALPPEAPGERTAFGVLEEAIADCQREGLAPAHVDAALLVVSAWSLVHGLASLLLDGPLALRRASTASADGANADGDGSNSDGALQLVDAVPDLYAALLAAAGASPNAGPKAGAKANAARARAGRRA